MKYSSGHSRPEFYLPHPSLIGLISHIMVLETSLNPHGNLVSKDGLFDRSPDSIIVGPQVTTRSCFGALKYMSSTNSWPKLKVT